MIAALLAALTAAFRGWWRRNICDDYDNLWPEAARREARSRMDRLPMTVVNTRIAHLEVVETWEVEA